MKTRVASSVVVNATRKDKGGRRELKAFKVVSPNGETKYFEEARPAYAWASRIAAQVEGAVKLFENAGGETFVFIAAFEDMRPMHKRVKPTKEKIAKRVETLMGIALGATSQLRWNYAVANPELVDVAIRYNK
jgi:hypothetical protein